MIRLHSAEPVSEVEYIDHPDEEYTGKGRCEHTQDIKEARSSRGIHHCTAL